MTDSEAIKAIKDNKPTSGYYILNEALDMAIQALERQKKIKENMTESKAKTILETEIVHHPECSIFSEALSISIQALEKQIPKKPIKSEKQVIRYVNTYCCPICKLRFTGTGIAKWCYHCGQKLDWSEWKNE